MGIAKPCREYSQHGSPVPICQLLMIEKIGYAIMRAQLVKAQDVNGATTLASALNSEAPLKMILLAKIKPLILQPLPMETVA